MITLQLETWKLEERAPVPWVARISGNKYANGITTSGSTRSEAARRAISAALIHMGEACYNDSRLFPRIKNLDKEPQEQPFPLGPVSIVPLRFKLKTEG